jgi:hypothetical protein
MTPRAASPWIAAVSAARASRVARDSGAWCRRTAPSKTTKAAGAQDEQTGTERYGDGEKRPGWADPPALRTPRSPRRSSPRGRRDPLPQR